MCCNSSSCQSRIARPPSPLASSARVIGKPIPTGASPEGICVGAGSVWVANSEDNTVTRINATRGQVAGDPIKVGRGPFGMVGGPNVIWVTNSQDNTATLIDPSNNQVVNLK